MPGSAATRAALARRRPSLRAKPQAAQSASRAVAAPVAAARESARPALRRNCSFPVEVVLGGATPPSAPGASASPFVGQLLGRELIPGHAHAGTIRTRDPGERLPIEARDPAVRPALRVALPQLEMSRFGPRGPQRLGTCWSIYGLASSAAARVRPAIQADLRWRTGATSASLSATATRAAAVAAATRERFLPAATTIGSGALA